MNYLLDTSILVHAVRESQLFNAVDQHFGLFQPGNHGFISEVSIGESRSLALQFDWGKTKKDKLGALLKYLSPIPISYEEIMNSYALIDAYSQNKHPYFSLSPGVPAKKMGKNDLWIAATTSILEDAILLTTDHDFDHLSPRFFNLENVSGWA